MDVKELIIDREDSSHKTSEPTKILYYFKIGEWKSGLNKAQKFLDNNKTDPETILLIYKAGCSLACKIIESQNIKLGMSICSTLNKLVSNYNSELFVSVQCEVLNYIAIAYKEKNKLYLARKFMEKALMIVEDFSHVH